eukprot:TRINITY_DN16602_c0_g1_i1.p1 TRINITY_DN16602_c0_g1~~TRINITY_DN16602_c0_g1_i1.p1  ORF type:complete len:269 (-),score=50.71 TRINITY_DN16602_c0_g1_i1:82-888(-)
MLLIPEGLPKGILDHEPPQDITYHDYEWIWHIIQEEDGSMQISLKGAGFDVYEKHGLKEHLQKEFGDDVQPIDTEETYDATYKVVAGPKICRLRAVVQQPPFLAMFVRASAGEKFPIMRIPMRNGESIYVESKDSLILYYSFVFPDYSDGLYAKKFFQELADLKKGDKTYNAAPGITYMEHEGPSGSVVKEANDAQTFWVELVLQGHHMAPKVAAKTIHNIYSFRTFVHYHLKCTKSHVHSRMRERTDQILKILNRAKIVKKDDKKKK